MDGMEKHKEPMFEGALEGAPVPKIEWVEPDFTREVGEIFGTAERLAENQHEKTEVALRIYEALSQGMPENLTDELWRHLQNSDSFSIATGDFDRVRELAKMYHRDFQFHINRILNREPVPAPTIVVYDNVPYKVGGNTRLMIARALGVRPKAVIARLRKETSTSGMPDLDVNSFEQLIEAHKSMKNYRNLDELNEDLVTRIPTETEKRNEAPEVQMIKKFANVYYSFETPPSLAQLVRKAHTTGVI